MHIHLSLSRHFNCVLIILKSLGGTILDVYCRFCTLLNIFAFLQDESRILRVKVIGGMGLAKKDILGARSVGYIRLCSTIATQKMTLEHVNVNERQI